MGNNFIRTLLSTIKAKITPIVTKVRFFLTPQFWKTQILSRFRQIFSKIFNVRPKDKDDYYGMGRYLVSKRLAYAIVLAVGVLSAVYLLAIRGVLVPSTGGIRTYKYNSVLLRFANSDKVAITGKGGYKAYEGAVSKGAVTGYGRLYNKENNLVYQGNFEANKYNGQGSTYYNSGGVCYNGAFADNMYEGEGKLYREAGSLEYSGEFSRGLKNGTGTLYNESSAPVYTGEFSNDRLVYASLLGLSASEAREKYVGDWVAYQYQNDSCVYMKDINAIYLGKNPDESVKEEVSVDSVYVLENHFGYGDRDCKSIADLKELFGEPMYQGNSNAILPEAVAINIISNYRTILNGNIQIENVQRYKEYISIDSFDREYDLYLYSYERDGLLYTFICRDAESNFEFYSITPATSMEDDGAEQTEQGEQ